MTTSAELNSMTVRELGALAKEVSIIGWHDMRKEELVRSLVQKSRTKSAGTIIKQRVENVGKSLDPIKKSDKAKPHSVVKTKEKSESTSSMNKASAKTPLKSSGSAERKKEVPRRREEIAASGVSKTTSKISPKSKSGTSDIKERLRLRRDISTQNAENVNDQFVLMVRDPFWLHAFWQLNVKAVERAKVAMGHFWYTAIPVIRLYRLESDGSSSPKRHFVRDVQIHGGVSHWYLDVTNPPSAFQAELGYLSSEKKFHSLVSSNTVETPQRQIVDELDKLDGNWRGVADDLGRIYKLSGGDAHNQDLREVFEKQLGRPMSAPLLSRYRASRNGGGLEKTRRNFQFEVDADVIIHGKTDPNVQVSIRNEPIKIENDGTFLVRFSLPEKRHVFPIEAEGNDGVEMQRVILTVERNTRILETLIQEHTEDD